MKTRCLAVLLSLMLIFAAVPVFANDVGGESAGVITASETTASDTTVLESTSENVTEETTAHEPTQSEPTEPSEIVTDENIAETDPVETTDPEETTDATEPEQEPAENPVGEEVPANEVTEPEENPTETTVDEEIPASEATEPENEEVVEPEETPAEEPLQEVTNPINQIIQEPIFPLIPEIQEPEKVFTDLKIKPETRITLTLKPELTRLSNAVQGGENIIVDIYSDDTLVGRIENGTVTHTVEFLPGNVYVAITGPAGAKFDVIFEFNAVEPEGIPAEITEDANISEPEEVIPVAADEPTDNTTEAE